MNIKINGVSEGVDRANISILDLLELKKVEAPDMVSVQYNGEILEREEFNTTTVKNGDDIEFLYFMGGGSQ